MAYYVCHALYWWIIIITMIRSESNKIWFQIIFSLVLGFTIPFFERCIFALIKFIQYNLAFDIFNICDSWIFLISLHFIFSSHFGLFPFFQIFFQLLILCFYHFAFDFPLISFVAYFISIFNNILHNSVGFFVEFCKKITHINLEWFILSFYSDKLLPNCIEISLQIFSWLKVHIYDRIFDLRLLL